MKVTRTWIATNFAEFNKKYFNGALLTPNFQICNTYRMLGQSGAKNIRSMHPIFTIKISNYFDRTEKEFQNTLLHEMIHLYFQSKGEWNVKHGYKFQQMARSFDKYGFNIHTTTQNFNPKVSGGNIPTRLVMVFDEIKGSKRTWVCCIANEKCKIDNFKGFISRSKDYTNARFYTTNSEKFASFKISHSRLGGKVCDKATFENEWLPLLKVNSAY